MFSLVDLEEFVSLKELSIDFEIVFLVYNIIFLFS
jgi:hypothetical protein